MYSSRFGIACSDTAEQQSMWRERERERERDLTIPNKLAHVRASENEG